MAIVPNWFILVPFVAFFLPTIILFSVISQSRKRKDQPQYETQIMVLPFLAFMIPMIFFSLFLLQTGIVMVFMSLILNIIFPAMLGFVLLLALVWYWYDITTLAPEAKPFAKVRKDLKRGINSMVLRVVYGNNATKYIYGKVEKLEKDSNLIVRTKGFGLKLNALNFPEVKTERSFDGQVSILNISPTMLNSVAGTMVVPVHKLIEFVRKNYQKLSYLDNLNLVTLLGKQGKELDLDAHLFLSEYDPKLTIDELITMVIEIQDKAAQEKWEIPPGYTFYTYNEAFDVINCPYTSKMLQDFELDIKRISEMKREKADLARVALYCGCAAAIAFAGVGFALKLGLT